MAKTKTEDEFIPSVYVEVKHLTQIEMETYSTSLKRNYYLQDMANCIRKETRAEERREFAIRLLKRKMPIDDVISLTDLTKEQVQELLK